MGIITRMLKQGQKAVYWPLAEAGETTDEFGVPILSVSPIEIDVRWEDVTEEFMDAKGDKRISRAVVFVDRDLDIGGLLFEGVLTDITDFDNPSENPLVYEIRSYERLPNLRNKEILRTVRL